MKEVDSDFLAPLALLLAWATVLRRYSVTSWLGVAGASTIGASRVAARGTEVAVTGLTVALVRLGGNRW